MSKFQNIELERAQFAYQCAEFGVSIKEKQQRKNDYYLDANYKSYVKKIPSMIKTNGLGATFAFIYSKRKSAKNIIQSNGEKVTKAPGDLENPKNAYDLLYEQTRCWLINNPVNPLKSLANGEFMEELLKLDSDNYRLCTLEVLTFFQWLRRFAEGVKKDESSEKQQNEEL